MTPEEYSDRMRAASASSASATTPEARAMVRVNALLTLVVEAQEIGDQLRRIADHMEPARVQGPVCRLIRNGGAQTCRESGIRRPDSLCDHCSRSPIP